MIHLTAAGMVLFHFVFEFWQKQIQSPVYLVTDSISMILVWTFQAFIKRLFCLWHVDNKNACPWLPVSLQCVSVTPSLSERYGLAVTAFAATRSMFLTDGNVELKLERLPFYLWSKFWKKSVGTRIWDTSTHCVTISSRSRLFQGGETGRNYVIKK